MTSSGSPVAELGPERWESEGLEVCGYCFCGFDAARPPHRVVMVRDERSGTYRYTEDRPWHEECVASKNAEPSGVQGPEGTEAALSAQGRSVMVLDAGEVDDERCGI